MLKKFSILTSPSDWYFKNPDDGFTIKGSSLQDVATKVRSYRSQNQQDEIQYLENVIENWLCCRKENWGKCEKLPPLKRGLYTTLKAGVLLIKQMMYNSFASQELADSRALTCVNCKANSFPDKDGFIKWADDIAEQTVGDRKSKYHEQIGNCEVCTCLLRSKIFYNEKIKLKKEIEDKMREVNPKCWQLPENNK